jgi:hypothetical protein
MKPHIQAILELTKHFSTEDAGELVRELLSQQTDLLLKELMIAIDGLGTSTQMKEIPFDEINDYFK